jgi:hypothetical protein
MASMPSLSVPPPNLVVVPSNTSNLEMLQRPLEFALDTVRMLLRHPAFTVSNPNRMRALVFNV